MARSDYNGFKVGDRVKYVGDAYGMNGAVGTVIKRHERSTYSYYGYSGRRYSYNLEVEFDNGKKKEYAASRFVAAPAAEASAPTTANSSAFARYMVQDDQGRKTSGESVDAAVREYINLYGASTDGLEAFGFRSLGKVVSKDVTIFTTED